MSRPDIPLRCEDDDPYGRVDGRRDPYVLDEAYAEYDRMRAERVDDYTPAKPSVKQWHELLLGRAR